MVFFNWATMQMAAKIVYYGPGLGGKTTNLSYIYAKTAPGSRGEMVSLETETDRTLFFDLLPIEVGKVAGFRTRLQLYTVPGQVFYNTTRKLVLKGVDGVVFVADSQRPMADANVESFANLRENLAELGLEVNSMPLTLQYNKRDLRNIMSVDEMDSLLDPQGRWEHHEAVAVDGVGVFETLKSVTKGTLRALRRRMVAQDSGGNAAASRPAPRPVAFSPAGLKAAVQEGIVETSPAPSTATTAAATAPAAPTPAPPREITEADRDLEPSTAKSPGPEAAELPAADLVEAVEVLEAVEVVDDVDVEPFHAEAVEAADEARVEEAEEVEDVLEAAEADEQPADAGSEIAFATTPEPAPPTEVRHVRVSSSLDILSELENLRKSSTWESPSSAAPGASLDLDSLLQGSINSRKEVRRRIARSVGDALNRADRCRVSVELLAPGGGVMRSLDPVDIELESGQGLRELALVLTVDLKNG